MSFNEKIREKLEEIDPMVFYGRAGKLDETVLWNYIVFFRDKRTSSESRTSHTVTFHVAVVRENEIPEGLEETVIEKVLELPGVKLGNESTYAYTDQTGNRCCSGSVGYTVRKSTEGTLKCGKSMQQRLRNWRTVSHRQGNRQKRS